uniref:Uncharacterized protein n=1 Tax=Romanomermis culicivorax TaxID=13658 RepID=A0A915KNS7_ROMCU
MTEREKFVEEFREEAKNDMARMAKNIYIGFDKWLNGLRDKKTMFPKATAFFAKSVCLAKENWELGANYLHLPRLIISRMKSCIYEYLDSGQDKETATKEDHHMDDESALEPVFIPEEHEQDKEVDIETKKITERELKILVESGKVIT